MLTIHSFFYKNNFIRTWASKSPKIKKKLRTFLASNCQFMHIIAFSCIFLYKNKHNLRTFEARGKEKIKNIEPRPKFTGSYKKKRVYA